jgi:DNA mismatch repair protein MutS
MEFQSILFLNPDDSRRAEARTAPGCFADLNLDQIVDAATAGRQEYDVTSFFYAPLRDREAIAYRHEVFQDLEQPAVRDSIRAFTEQLAVMRRYRVMCDKHSYTYGKEAWLLESAHVYCDAVQHLVERLDGLDLRSCGLRAFREYIGGYAESASFLALAARVRRLKEALASIRYCVLIKGNTVRVRKYEGEADYSDEVDSLFAKFKQGAAKSYLVEMPISMGMGHVEASILSLVAKLYPETFEDLDDFAATMQAFADVIILRFDREIQFYLAWLEFIGQIKHHGLAFCYPSVAATTKQVWARGSFDLALANKLSVDGAPVICNDFCLHGAERIFVVSGPNQGGKTTFARMFGQVHYLASLGCPVPGSAAQLFLCDQIFTHFGKEEAIVSHDGKLQDDLKRIHAILARATPESIIIMNEIFTSTTVSDALLLGTRILQAMSALDALCVCVTFLDELSVLNEKTVSMVSTVVPENPSQRTFKVVRRPADGRSYALAIAEKYRLTYDALKERIHP